MTSQMTFKPLLISLALCLSPIIVAAPAHAEKAPVYTGLFTKVALQGYDTVAYFTDKKPVKGSDKYVASYKGADFYFASAANRDAFKADPEKYAPQFGGYCAWAVAQGYTAKGDARNWAVVDGKLYLNYDDSVQAKWNRDRAGFIASGKKNWPEVLKK